METENQPPAGARWKLIGPGLVAAATGVGAGDLVATLIAGTRFGYALLWAAVIGCIVKIALAEGVGRYHLATGRTIFQGWQSLGRWTSWYFGAYILVWGFLYGATAMSATALPLTALMPFLPLWGWAIFAGITGFVFVWFNHYQAFENVMKALVAVMFVVMVGLAALVVPRLGAILSGLAPGVPQGSLFYTLGLIGGVGGTITIAAYGYWTQAKGWRGPAWLGVMRLDNGVAYAVTGIFVIAMLIVGAELLYGAQVALASGGKGLVDLADILAQRFGRPIAMAFLIGFAASAFSSLLGVWQGVSLMFADFVAHVGGPDPEDTQTGWPYRAYLLWLTFPPMALLFLGKPFFLVILYGAFGAFFMPFLAVTLLLLLNRRDMPVEARSGWLSNAVLACAALLFVLLCGQEIWGLIG
ncbi:Nramp family divalent metal transporter [Stakelama tenebrarum]|uniref:Divalent metal cation transporter n=1 Tax=Stakelama tenebrarum TaxID=2711215 RepID=A0A6G6Y7Q4_9SPHN|nr:Nramp family divalent metal transporter [Sphingosinithalassobacter tenebrarum]QIG80972.1 divalent metal cation transporter [Sphingosinithalassobacter tenebrarum]